jgi:selenide,water dikinase
VIARDCIPGGSRDNLKTANRIVDWKRTPPSRRALLTDAQTSGGLLLSVAPSHLNKVLALLKRHRTACAAIIGKIVPAREPLLCINE